MIIATCKLDQMNVTIEVETLISGSIAISESFAKREQIKKISVFIENSTVMQLFIAQNYFDDILNTWIYF